MALLAVVQGAFGLLRAYGWVQIGVDLFREGLLILPAVGAVAVLRGMFIAGVTCLYFLFFCGVLLGTGWARWVCLTAAVVNLLVVLSALAQGAPVAEAIAWSVIPAILIFYLFSQIARIALKGA
jgi:hypothetical protein